jgi:hypothetical protein
MIGFSQANLSVGDHERAPANFSLISYNMVTILRVGGENVKERVAKRVEVGA